MVIFNELFQTLSLSKCYLHFPSLLLFFSYFAFYLLKYFQYFLHILDILHTFNDKLYIFSVVNL